jgi:predicted transposase YdaD
MKSFLVSDGHYLENSKLSRRVHNVQNMSVEHDDFQVNVVMTQVESKEHKNYGKSAVKCHLLYASYLLKLTPQVPFPGMSNRQMYNACNLTMLDT